MVATLVIEVALAALLPSFWILQMRTGFLSTRFFLQVGWLALIGGSSLLLSVRLLFIYPLTVWLVVGSLICAASAVYHLSLFSFKLTSESDSRFRRMRKASRALVRFDCPHQRFTVRTDDGVLLSAVGINNKPTHPGKAIIVCHGAGRSKNSLPVVQTCQLLAVDYPVFTFDFRGHMQSGGTFKADGDTELDLKAMIDHVRKMGFSKVAVFGWSIGGWTALLSAATGRKIDAVIAGAPPPVDISTLRQIRMLRRYRSVRPLVRAGVAVMRNLRTKLGVYALQISDFATHIPRIPILLVYNDYDTVSRVDSSAFERLYEILPDTTEKLVLPGNGHLFDWPNTYFLWGKMMEWLKANY